MDQEPSLKQFQIEKRIQASDEGTAWINDLSTVFPIYDWFPGYPDRNIHEQIASYLWEPNETSERLSLIISRGDSSRDTFFRVTLSILPLSKKSQQRTLYGSDFSEINIIRDNSNDSRFARLLTSEGDLLFDIYPNGEYSMKRVVKEKQMSG